MKPESGGAQVNDRLKGAAPYVVVLLIAAFLFFKSTQFGFEAPGGRIGPDMWPKIVLGLLGFVCIYEIVKRLFFGGGEAEVGGVLESVVEKMPDGGAPGESEPEPSHRWLLLAGILMAIGYVALLGYLGFFLCTALFLASFIYLGGYRGIAVTIASSLVGSLAFVFVFMKVVYVSLPLGVEPFAQVSFLLMRLMGIR